jgi:outer membrane immunogenic protein
MKKLLISTAILALGAGEALAADLYTPPPVEAVVYEEPAFNWTGFYAGVHGGLAGGDFDYGLSADDSIFGPFDIGASLDSSGFFAGGQVGFNWQAGQWVFGAEADIAWADIEGDLEIDIDDLGSAEAGSAVNWFGTGRLRLGFLPTQRLLVYGTGGVAYGDVESYLDVQDDNGNDVFNISTSDTQIGWTIGGGFEYAVTNNITLKTEYLYVDLGDQTLFQDDVGFADNLNIDADTKFHTIKAGLNFLW